MLPPVPLAAKLPKGVTWWGVHGFTITQIALTSGVFAVTLSKAAPAFPMLIIALVPIRLCCARWVWGRETLRWVDCWACREGGPEDEVVEEAGGDRVRNVKREEHISGEKCKGGSEGLGTGMV